MEIALWRSARSAWSTTSKALWLELLLDSLSTILVGIGAKIIEFFFFSQFDRRKGELGVFGKVDFCNSHPTMSEILSSQFWLWFRLWFAWTSFDPTCIHNSILMKGIVSAVDLCGISLWTLEIPSNTFPQWKISMMLHGFIVWLLSETISQPGCGLQNGEKLLYILFVSCFAAAWV